MTEPKHQLVCAIPFGWGEWEPWIGIVTGYRNKTWGLPKVSVGAKQSADQLAPEAAGEQGGFFGRVVDELVSEELSEKGVRTEYFAVEIDYVRESWDGDDDHRRKEVPLSEIGRFIDDRATLRAVRAFAEQYLGVEAVEAI